MGSDSNDSQPGRTVSRRTFVDGAGVAGLGLVLGRPSASLARQARSMAAANGMEPAAPREKGRIFLSDDEHAFIVAAVGRLIPSDGEGPGAIEADVPNFFDKQLGGAWGSGERLFLGGPFDPNAIPQMGYQLPYTPADLFRRSMAAIMKRQAGTKTFAEFDTEAQDKFLRDELEHGGLGDLDGVPAKVFFEHLLAMTIEGYLSDPVYGGNKDMVAWKAIGFPGAYASYAETIGQHGNVFQIGPYSMADHDRIPDHDMSSMEQQR